jgi:hypothetical protein
MRLGSRDHDGLRLILIYAFSIGTRFAPIATLWGG